MFRNYLKTAIRNLRRQKLYAAINLFGLSFGMACCFLISLYVFNEHSYDTFFEDSDRIYRVALDRHYPEHTRSFSSSSVMVAPILAENYPDVEHATRLHRLFFVPQIIVTVEDRSFQETRFLFADSNFFDVFSVPFIEGDPTTALDVENKVILTRSTAERYFGEVPALDQILETSVGNFVISAVIEDIPDHSHIGVDLIGSVSAVNYLQQAEQQNNWVAPWLYTYVKLRAGTSPSAFEARLDDMVREYGAEQIKNQLGLATEDYNESGHAFDYFLQPLHDIHLHSNLEVELQPNGNSTYVNVLTAIVLFILLISCINFINLATARSTERAREIGVRKVMGSFRSHLIGQFLTESVLISVVSLIFAIGIAWLALPVFNGLVDKQFGIDVILDPRVVIGLIGFALLVGLLAGSYPALMMSSMEASKILKGSFKASRRGIWLRNSLVVFQFAISMILIAGVLIVERQLDYVASKDLGFDKENVLVIKQAGVLALNAQAFMDELRSVPNVLAVGGTNAVPGAFFGSSIFSPDDPALPQVRTNVQIVDDTYLQTLGIEVAAGRLFSSAFNDTLKIIINEAAARMIGWDDPVGRSLQAANMGGTNPPPVQEIIGVVKDYNFQSLHETIVPLVISNGAANFAPSTIAVRIGPGDVRQTISAIQSVWRNRVSEQEMFYGFLDQDLDALYQADQTSGRVISAFTLLAILLACVGLFGMAAYTTQQRTKEISIRKVLGASVTNIMLLLSRDFTRLILIAFVVAAPIAYWSMDRWLDTFAYRTEITPFTLVLTCLITLVLAWFTISYQSIKAAVSDPVKSLRSD